MSGLYTMLHGVNPLAGLALSHLGKTPGDFGRFRDAWLEGDGKGGIVVAVFTRCGGGNREDYQGVFDDCTTWPGYLGDEDDEFDSTYATIRFAGPTPEALLQTLQDGGATEDQAKEIVEAIQAHKEPGMWEKTQAALAAMGQPPEKTE